jgi:hypothetical protein
MSQQLPGDLKWTTAQRLKKTQFEYSGSHIVRHKADMSFQTQSYDTIWYDMMWYMIWYMIWYDMIWYDMIWYDMIWYDMIWYDMIWYDMFNCNWVATRWQ